MPTASRPSVPSSHGRRGDLERQRSPHAWQATPAGTAIHLRGIGISHATSFHPSLGAVCCTLSTSHVMTCSSIVSLLASVWLLAAVLTSLTMPSYVMDVCVCVSVCWWACVCACVRAPQVNLAGTVVDNYSLGRNQTTLTRRMMATSEYNDLSLLSLSIPDPLQLPRYLSLYLSHFTLPPSISIPLTHPLSPALTHPLLPRVPPKRVIHGRVSRFSLMAS